MPVFEGSDYTRGHNVRVHKACLNMPMPVFIYVGDNDISNSVPKPST